MDKKREQKIAARAYLLWEEEGRPDGAHERHWEQASREIAAAERTKPGARPKAKAGAGASGKLASAQAKAKSAVKAKQKAAAAATAKGGETKRGAKSAAATKPAKRAPRTTPAN
jgi:hypothetical protein